jgi:hypothetical protein
MTTLDNLRTRKLQLEQHLKQVLAATEREEIEQELMKIDIALSFLDNTEAVLISPPTGPQ